MITHTHPFFKGVGILSQEGTHFVLGFIENRARDDYPIGRLYITTDNPVPVSVTISVPRLRDADTWWTEANFNDVEYSVTHNIPVFHDLPYDVHMFGNSIEDKGKTSGGSRLIVSNQNCLLNVNQ